MPAVARELPINTSATGLAMAQEIFGAGVVVNAGVYYGDPNSSGIYSNGDAVAPGVTPSDTGVILSTGNAQDITNSSGDANQATDTSTNTSGFNNWGPFNTLAGASTYDGAALQATFVPQGDTLTMQFVFASEEYPEYTGSQFNDMVGIWINGQLVPFGSAEASVGGVNDTNNVNLYVDNTSGDHNTEMDGFTVTMNVTIPVNALQANTIIIGIADVADSAYDSNLLIAGDSVQAAFVAQNDSFEVRPDKTVTMDVLGNDESTTAGQIAITQINGIDVVAGDSVTLATGEVVTLNADGTLTALADADEGPINFTYTAVDASGQQDVATVTLDTVPCFTAGTLIRTPRGEVPVESLRPGDLVETLDEGPRPVRWAGARTIPAAGDMAPIRIAGGTFGRHRMTEVSPQHRVLVRSVAADLMFGSAEVLVKAKDLVNGRTVRRREGGEVTYVHLLFDRHQVIWSDGLPTESFLPGPQTAHVLEEAGTAEEIARIFPGLDPRTGAGYGPAARPALRGFEARALAS